MANSPPSIKDNPFKRLDALRTKVSGVKSPAPAAAPPPVPPRRPSDGGAGAEHGMPRRVFYAFFIMYLKCLPSLEIVDHLKGWHGA